MISTEKIAHTAQIHFNKQPHAPVKKQLVASWQTIKGQLVCKWVEN